MAEIINKIEKFRKTWMGTVIEVLIYTAMIILIFTFFTGNGKFIYEAF